MVPKKVFFTKGVGKHKNQLQSFELALRNAGIEKCNLVNVSSIVPPNCKILSKEKGMQELKPGAITHCVMSRNNTNEPNRLIGAAIGVATPKNRDNYGYISEHHCFGEVAQKAGDYAEAYYVHGLAVQTAEATAEYLHRHIRRELGLSEGQGKRYSWGYPAIPDLDDHRKVFDLLPAESELGMSLTAAYQLVPEQSTAAIIVHHLDAKYFNVGESRVDQLTQ